MRAACWPQSCWLLQASPWWWASNSFSTGRGLARWGAEPVGHSDQAEGRSLDPSPNPNTPTREQWGSRRGFLLAAAGSAVGLGNLWGFPYKASSHGGAAFVLIY